ncbi:MAG: DUF4363 family protein [Clostridia bacterium]|nr:DUF4363 family protein [Clostridia bacterium]
MKRLIASAVILSLVLALCFFGVRYATNAYEIITDELSLGEEYMKKGEFGKAKKHCEKAEKLYTEREQFMAAFVNHGILDEIGQTIAGVAPLADKDTVPEFLSLCSEAKIALTHLRNDHIFLIGNLF